jgi:glycosyltransferase involved in cell wall biosynthesis
MPNLVSIIVASYNHAEYLQQRMDSLINQTYPEIEILVIDDCSSDNSLEVLRKYESHPKVKLISLEKNGGLVAVNNQGVEISTGEFIIFANCDDSCDPEMVDKLVKAIHEYPSAGISFCRSLLIDASGRVLGNDFDIRESRFRKKCGKDVLIDKKEMSHFLLHSCVMPNLSNILFRRKCYAESGGFSSKFRVCLDWESTSVMDPGRRFSMLNIL